MKNDFKGKHVRKQFFIHTIKESEIRNKDFSLCAKVHLDFGSTTEFKIFTSVQNLVKFYEIK